MKSKNRMTTSSKGATLRVTLARLATVHNLRFRYIPYNEHAMLIQFSLIYGQKKILVVFGK